jgi:hypothetical protein
LGKVGILAKILGKSGMLAKKIGKNWNTFEKLFGL